jgi:hypothetical protein
MSLPDSFNWLLILVAVEFLPNASYRPVRVCGPFFSTFRIWVASGDRRASAKMNLADASQYLQRFNAASRWTGSMQSSPSSKQNTRANLAT